MKAVEQAVLEWLRQACACKCAGVFITPETDLFEQGLLDSLGILELIAFIESSFGVAIPLDQFVPENFSTPQAVFDLVHRQAPSLA